MLSLQIDFHNYVVTTSLLLLLLNVNPVETMDFSWFDPAYNLYTYLYSK